MIAPGIGSALTANLIAIIGVGVAPGILMLDTAGRIESRIDRAIAESQADVRAFQAEAAPDPTRSGPSRSAATTSSTLQRPTRISTRSRPASSPANSWFFASAARTSGVHANAAAA